MQEKEQRIRQIKAFLDVDPTDELPILPPESSPPDTAPPDDDLADTARQRVLHADWDRSATAPGSSQFVTESRRSLSRLESEFEALQARKRNVERQLRARDAEIDRLQADVDKRHAIITALREELKDAEATTRDLYERHESLETELRDRETEVDRQRTEIAAREATIDRLRAEAQALRSKLQALQSGTAQRADDATRPAASGRPDARRILRQQQRIQDLELYIDGSNRARRGLEAKLETQAERLSALEKSDKTWEKRTRRLERERAKLREMLARLQGLEPTQSSPAASPEQRPASRTPAPPAAHDRGHRPPAADSGRDPVTRLLITVGESRPLRFPLYKKIMRVGRAADSDIQIYRSYVSRQHARLRNEKAGTYIEDLGSTNGVRVNASEINDLQLLRDGDLVEIGDARFQFLDLDAAQRGADAT